MKILIIFIIFSTAHASEYTGPKQAGIEYYECGEYQIKGEIRHIKGLKIDTQFVLDVYPKTVRNYSIKIKGEISDWFKLQKEPRSILVKGMIRKKGLGTEITLLIKEKLKLISSYDVLKNSVTLIKKQACIE